MAGRQIYNPEAFKNVEADGKIIGFSFEFKAQYYRGFTLSIVRDIKVNVDGVDYPREAVRFTVNGETFTLEEMRTVIDSDYRWEFGEYAKVTVLVRSCKGTSSYQRYADHRTFIHAIHDRSKVRC